jgi:hypothetical protein
MLGAVGWWGGMTTCSREAKLGGKRFMPRWQFRQAANAVGKRKKKGGAWRTLGGVSCVRVRVDRRRR